MFLVRPFEDAKRDSDIAGAYANCWIDRPDRDAAEEVAREMIRASSWSIEAIEEYSVVSDAHYETDESGRQYYEQALIDKEVLVFHTWPVSGKFEDESAAG